MSEFLFRARRFLGQGRQALGAALVAGVVLRLMAIIVLGVGHSPVYEFGVIGHNLDVGRSYSYFSVQPAGTVVIDNAHTGRPLPSAFMPPGYTVAVAGALRVSGSQDNGVRLLQVLNLVAFAIGAIALWNLAVPTFGREAAGLAALGYALYPSFVYQATQVSASNLYLPLEILAMLLLLSTQRSPTVRGAALSGLAIGILGLFRSEAVVIIPFAAFWLWWWTQGQRRRAFRLCAAFLVPAFLVLGTWMVRNTAVLGRITPTITTSGGFNLWIGNHQGATGSQKQFVPESRQLQDTLDRIAPDSSYEAKRDRAYLHDALHSMVHHPIETLLRDLKKLGLILTVDTYDSRSYNPAYLGAWLVLLPLGVLGLWSRPVRGPTASLLYGELVFSLLVPLVFFALDRYKLTVEVVLLLFAARWAVDRLPDRAVQLTA